MGGGSKGNFPLAKCYACAARRVPPPFSPSAQNESKLKPKLKLQLELEQSPCPSATPPFGQITARDVCLSKKKKIIKKERTVRKGEKTEKNEGEIGERRQKRRSFKSILRYKKLMLWDNTVRTR